MDLHQYVHALRRFWWVILIPTVLLAASGVDSALNVPPRYRASTTFFVSTAVDPSASAVQGDAFARVRVNSYVALAPSERLARLVVDTGDLDLTPQEVARMMGATGDLDTVLLTVTVTSRSRAVASEVGDAVAEAFPMLVDEMESATPASPAAVRLEVVSGPTVRELPTRGSLTVATRAAFGLLLGIAAAVLLQLRDTTVGTDEEIEALGAGTVLGRIPFDRRVRATPLLVEDDPQSAIAEAFRQLRTNLLFLAVDPPVHVLVVTSALPAAGKSVTASNVAVSLASADLRVLLVEGDLRRPTVADHFGIDRAQGLTEVLSGQIPLEAALQPWGDHALQILPSGQLPANPSELLGSAAMERLVDELRHSFDVVIVDTPPLLLVSDPAVAAVWADGVILAVREGKTTRRELGLAVRALRAVNARLLGAAVTMASPGALGRYDRYAYRTEPAEPTWNRSRASEVLQRLVPGRRPIHPWLEDALRDGSYPLPPSPVAETVRPTFSGTERPSVSDAPTHEDQPSSPSAPGGNGSTAPIVVGESGAPNVEHPSPDDPSGDRVAAAARRVAAEAGSASAAESATVAPFSRSDWGGTPRNAPCPCGSGKKFKLCHGKA